VLEFAGECNREVGMERAKDGIGSAAPGDFRGAPCQRGGGAERTRFDEEVGARDLGDDVVQGVDDVRAGDDQHPFRRHERGQAQDRVRDERALVDEGEHLLGAMRRAQRPESGPDATREHHRPESLRRVDQRFEFGLVECLRRRDRVDDQRGLGRGTCALGVSHRNQSHEEGERTGWRRHGATRNISVTALDVIRWGC
jgi:hypothetical protein